MDMKQFLEKYVVSKDTRNYLMETGHKFTLQEQATIIQNGRNAIKEKHIDLFKIMEKIEDSDIKRQIKERLAYDADAIKIFEENSEGYVYALIYQEYDDNDIISGYYGSFDIAYDAGIREGVRFKIEKYQIVFEDSQVVLPKAIWSPLIEPNIEKQVEVSKEYTGCPVSGQYYNEEGDLIYYWSDEMPIERMRVVDSLSNKRFENMFIKIPDPFISGDKVRTLGEKEYHGIIVKGAKNNIIDKRKKKSLDDIKDYADASLIIDVIDDIGYGLHLHVNPFFVEQI